MCRPAASWGGASGTWGSSPARKWKWWRDPVALRLPGFTLSLRNNEADYIVVEPLEQAG